MRTLIINKFLYANGGSETYIFKLGEHLQKMGHEKIVTKFIEERIERKGD